MLRTLLTRRWVTALALALIFALACVLLGNWQYSRHREAVADRDRIEQNYDAAPMPLAQVLASPAAVLSPTQEWVRVTVAGRYLPDDRLLVRNRPHRGVYGYAVLVPLRVDAPATDGEAADADPAGGGAADRSGSSSEGPALLVDRGWVRNADDASTLPPVPPPPQGKVEVQGWLRLGEPDLGRDLLAGQLASINVTEAAQRTGLDLYEGYLVLGSEEVVGGSSPARPEPLERPDTGLGSHFAYALQWWLTAPLGVVLVGVFVRREHLERTREAKGADTERRPARPRKVRIWDEEDA